MSQPKVSLGDKSEDDVFDAMLLALAEPQKTGLKPACYRDWEPLMQATCVNHLGTGLDHSLYSTHPHEHPDWFKLQAAFWRLLSKGYATPATTHGFVNGLYVTDRGLQASQAKAGAKNPFAGGYLDHLMTTHAMAGRPEAEEVFLRLQDAAACLDSDLFRPAVVMLGIAAEVTTFQAYSAMKTLSLVSGKHDEFAARLEAIRKELDGLALQPDQKRRLSMALDMIESARVMRNNAAHSGNPNPEPFLARERFGSACFHLPVVWEIVIVPNLPP